MRFSVFVFTLALVYYVEGQYNPCCPCPTPPTVPEFWAERLCFCTSQYDPVCGSDMKRYTNSCTFDCRNDYLRQYNQTTITSVDCRTFAMTEAKDFWVSSILNATGI